MPAPPRNQQPRYPRPPIVNRGPAADELQPPKRRDPGLIYHEDLIRLFDDPKGSGEAKCRAGVHMEICRTIGAELVTDGGNEARIFLAFLDPNTRKPIMFEPIDPRTKRATAPRLRWLAINQTIKGSLKTAFGTSRTVNWIGWITLYITEVENNLKKKRGEPPPIVTAIRVMNRLPDLEPTFDYAKAIAKRVEELKAPPAPENMPHPGAGDDAADEYTPGEEDMSEAELAQIAAAEARSEGASQ